MHPNVRKKYVENDFEDQIVSTASDNNEEAFNDQVAQSKQPVKKQITKIVRLKKGGVEHFYYHQELTSRNYLGNKIHYYQVVGKYDDPEFNKVVGNKGKPIAVEIESTETVYEYKWPDDWNDELEDLISETVDLLLITPGRKYGGFSFQDFKDRTFDELVTIGKYGTLMPKVIEVEKKRQSRNA